MKVRDMVLSELSHAGEWLLTTLAAIGVGVVLGKCIVTALGWIGAL